MAKISHKFKFIYSLAPRTASTATAEYLEKYLCAEEVIEDNIFNSAGTIVVDKKHLTFSDIKNYKIIAEKFLDKYLKFVTVRNPFDSLYSLWYKMKNTYVPLLNDNESWIYRKPGYLENMKFVKDHTFSEWIIRTYSQKLDEPTHLYNSHLKLTNRVIRFERLKDDLQKVLEDLYVDIKVDIPVLNKTDGRESDYKISYSKEAQEIVRKVFYPDLKRFGYTFE